ncbi:GNAT family N-acetyltransferase [Rhodoblastus acidophilus]|uniref:GNAT family N-acetyltransferase n=1 Tax=Candidatus Rhodoblastus alkanivorans TaxID=2954117 RepID=A0ABS9ZC43_9HYPH|nr:GNAT family protein [Candidatus Rhodoblastus alkanivorans]MCI4677780.1 GNAT family N-acetyltransferase [Candidatus Rhodoblastus alkanivorans]MCI4684722.1 GNAT family N-acetyltransferase [Candidatus Rhodoblastus alkanivorans]MDI4642044.1 GNAT family N-acetyltransferase [Rhodoblastus acidophilus]
MNLFGLSRKKTSPSRIEGEGLYLRPAVPGDFESWRLLRGESRAFLTPWEPSWPLDDLTRPAFLRRILRQDQERAEDESHGFLIFRAGDDALLGGITLGNLRRGVAQCGTLGYWMGEKYAGKGFMTKAVRALLRHAFLEMGLHRVEAACAPENERSRRLLERLGFQREGYARAYLLIDGAWQDHLLFAMLERDFLRGDQPGNALPERAP